MVCHAKFGVFRNAVAGGVGKGKVVGVGGISSALN